MKAGFWFRLLLSAAMSATNTLAATPLKWGIVGAGNISHDFITALHILPESDHKIVAVAARDQTRVTKYATDHQIPKAYDDYQKIAEDSDVEIIYIGNINSQHFETAKLMLQHGKHVLCETSFTINQKQASKLVEIAREKKLFLMEGIWSRFFPAYQKMKEIIESGEIGEVLYCFVQFGFDLQNINRAISLELGGGSTLDLGVYVLQFQQFLFRGLEPLKIAVNGQKNSFGTDDTAGAIITYPKGNTAFVITSAKVVLPNEALVIGTKGSLRLPQFWCPTKLITENKTYEWPLPESKGEFIFPNTAGFIYEAEGVRHSIRSGLLESSNITLDESVKLAGIMDFIREQIGVVYPADSLEV